MAEAHRALMRASVWAPQMRLPGAEAPPEMSLPLIGMREDPAELIMIMSLGRRESQGALLGGQAREAAPLGLARSAGGGGARRPGRLAISGVAAVGGVRRGAVAPFPPQRLPPPEVMAAVERDRQRPPLACLFCFGSFVRLFMSLICVCVCLHGRACLWVCPHHVSIPAHAGTHAPPKSAAVTSFARCVQRGRRGRCHTDRRADRYSERSAVVTRCPISRFLASPQHATAL